MSSSSTAATVAFRNLALSLPIAIWSVDNLVSFARVRGTSMEPTLKDGDIVVVSKSDFFLGFGGTTSHHNHHHHHNNNNHNTADPTTDDDHDGDDSSSRTTRRRSPNDETDRARLARVESSIGNTPSTLWSKPPEILNGHIVVYKSPHNAYPHEYHIKRVLGIGGQMIRPTQRLRSIEQIPKYSIWAEGDNTDIQSEDSCSYGPVSKKLLVGRADRIVWPPWRWGALEKKYPSSGKAWWP